MRFLITISWLFLIVNAFSQSLPKREYSVQNIEESNVEIDGNLNEPVWKLAHWGNQFIQIIPYEGRQPHFQTEFAILSNKKNIYIAIKAFDKNPDSVSVRMTRRDEAEGDVVGITLDTYHDKRTGFGFSVSAAGIKTDFVMSDDGEFRDNTWDPIWWVKTKVTSEGWNAEMCIPLTQLRFKEGGDEQVWGMQINRYIFRFDESSAWQPMKREQPGYISNFGTLTGLKNITPKNTLDFTPYVVARLENFEKEPENPFRATGKKSTFDAGLDAKIGLTNYLTMDLTINPDFGQVEADPSRVNLSAYETFYEEKRPFFVEGKNILKYQLQMGDSEWTTEGLFYSRRIGRQPQIAPHINTGEYAEVPEFTRILGAAKITGKSKNGWSVGILESMTGKEFAKIRDNGNARQQPVEPLTNYFVSRVQKDFNEGNTYFGGIFTAVNRNIDDQQLTFLHKSAYSGGIDWTHKWANKKWTTQGGLYMSQVNGSNQAISRTQLAWIHNFARPDADYMEFDPERTSLTGYGGKLSISKLLGQLKYGGMFSWRSPTLELNDIGFAQQIDQLSQVVWVNYQIYEPFSVFRNINLNVSEYAQWDFGGNKNSLGYTLTNNTQFKNYWNLSANFSFSGDQLSNTALRGGPAIRVPGYRNVNLTILTNPQKNLTFQLVNDFNFSQEKDYHSGKGVYLNIGYRPLKTLRLDITPGVYLSEGTLQYVDKKSFNESTRYIFAHINQNTLNMSFRLNYNLNPDLTIQFWGQPFLAIGEYSNFKYITNSKAENTEDRYRLYSAEQISLNTASSAYFIDDDTDGAVDYTFSKPDFNVKTFLSNLVLRWEYQPGSTVFLVWSQARNAYKNDGVLNFGNDVKTLFETKGDNIFLVKFSYRIGR